MSGFPLRRILASILAVILTAGGSALGSTHGSALIKGMAGPGAENSLPHRWSRRGDHLLFWAGDPAHGTALRALDTTTGQTRIVRDFDLDSTQIIENAPGFLFAAAQGWLVFFPTSVWRTDGTPQGTQHLMSWTPPIALTTGYMPLEHEGRVYFGAHDIEHGHELWSTDGTQAGTRLVKDLQAGPGDGTPEQLAVVGGKIFFTARQEETGAELWLTDGSDEGTRLIKDIFPGPSSSHLTDICALDQSAIFLASDGTHGLELWRSDGTTAGTSMIVDLSPGYTTAMPLELISVGPLVYFSAHTDATGRELWKTDGTATGTRMIKDLQTGTNDSYPSGFKAVNNRLVFMAFHGTNFNTPRLFTSDGTPAGTVAIQPSSLTPVWSYQDIEVTSTINGALYFVAASGSSVNRGIWRTDGTTAGTRQVFASGTWSASPQALIAVDSTLYLTGSTTTNRTGVEIWKWDVPKTALSLVANLNPEGWQSPPKPPLSTAAGMFFSGYGAASGFELWHSDGTAATTALVRDLNPGTAGSDLEGLTEGPEGRVYFSALTAASGRELWRSDGTSEGTQIVRDIGTGTQGSFPNGFVRLGDRLIFSAREELWASNGTSEGTVLVKDIRPGSSGSRPQYLTVLGNRVVFVANDGEHGNELWTTDGTEAGTVLLKDIFAMTGDVWPRIFGVAGGLVYFEQHDGIETYGLYATDGTTAGTRRVSAIRPADPANAAAVGATLYFLPDFAPNNQWLWKSDGTPAGTVAVKQLIGPRGPGTGSRLSVAGGLVYFHVRDPELGDQLWRSDGTEAGTIPLAPEAPDWDPVRMVEIVGVAGDRVYFAATTYRHGRELWSSNGTPAGTGLALDLAPGESSSLPRWVGPHAGRVFGIFSADPETRTPSLRSLVPPEAAPFFPGLDLDAWAGDTVSLSLARLMSLIEAPPGVTLQLELAADHSEAGGTLTLGAGLVTYAPPAGHLGDDRIPFLITGPGGPAVPASVTVRVVARLPDTQLQPTLSRPTAATVQITSRVLRGQQYVFERSIDLRTWTTLETRLAAVSEAAVWIDAQPPAGEAQYRVRPKP